MEVGDDGIDHFPLVSRIDIKLRPVAATLELSALAGRFQRADGRRAYGNDPSAFFFGFIDLLSRFFADGVPFLMHLMIFNILLRYRTESTDADMKCYKEEFCSFFLHFLPSVLA